MRCVSLCFLNFCFEILPDNPQIRHAHLPDFLIGEQTCQIYFDYLFREVCGSWQRTKFSSTSRPGCHLSSLLVKAMFPLLRLRSSLVQWSGYSVTTCAVLLWVYLKGQRANRLAVPNSECHVGRGEPQQGLWSSSGRLFCCRWTQTHSAYAEHSSWVVSWASGSQLVCNDLLRDSPSLLSHHRTLQSHSNRGSCLRCILLTLRWAVVQNWRRCLVYV